MFRDVTASDSPAHETYLNAVQSAPTTDAFKRAHPVFKSIVSSNTTVFPETATHHFSDIDVHYECRLRLGTDDYSHLENALDLATDITVATNTELFQATHRVRNALDAFSNGTPTVTVGVGDLLATIGLVSPVLELSALDPVTSHADHISAVTTYDGQFAVARTNCIRDGVAEYERCTPPLDDLVSELQQATVSITTTPPFERRVWPSDDPDREPLVA